MAMDLGIATHMTAPGAMNYHGNTASTAIQQVVAGTVPGTWSNNLAAEYVRQMISDPGRRQDLAFSDFALLYAATISGNNGARDSLATSIRGSTDTTAVLSALFGNGTQTGSIVNGVIIGGSAGKKDTYPDVRYALNHLGFRMVANPALNTLPSVSNGGPHYHHFHIYFQAPTRRDLPKLLVAETSSNFVMPTVAENLALAVSKPISAAVIRGVEKESLGVCNEVENPTSTKRIGLSNTGGLLNPGGLIARPLKFRYGIEPLGIISTTITKNPAHGSVMAGDWSRATQDAPQATYQYFKYVPNPGFIGKDSIGFEITVNGKTFRASLRINVLETWDNGDSCNPPGEDRGDLSDAPSYAWVLDGLSEILPVQAGTPEQWLQSAALSALIANASHSLTGFADLAATAIGETTGKGLTAQITLDTNSAGHGWYIDPTPLDNTDDYLPTSNPEVWQAKAGSAADGKMDLLSVLLHEYGHALGLEHSGNGADFMAASLEPRVRSPILHKQAKLS